MTGNKPAIKLPLWGTLLTVIGLAILITLGTWQLQRLQWKQSILDQLDAAYAQEDNTRPLTSQSFETGDFIYGRADGLFHPDKALLLGTKTRDGEIGADLIAPLETPQGTLFVNMGWTPYALEEQPIYHLQDEAVWFEGLARTPDWNHFTPENIPADNLWYKPDLAEIAAAKGLSNPLPYMLYAERASHKFDAQFPNNQRWAPNNNHLQYALFWYAMAAAMLIIYGLKFLRK